MREWTKDQVKRESEMGEWEEIGRERREERREERGERSEERGERREERG